MGQGVGQGGEGAISEKSKSHRSSKMPKRKKKRERRGILFIKFVIWCWIYFVSKYFFIIFKVMWVGKIWKWKSCIIMLPQKANTCMHSSSKNVNTYIHIHINQDWIVLYLSFYNLFYFLPTIMLWVFSILLILSKNMILIWTWSWIKM